MGWIRKHAARLRNALLAAALLGVQTAPVFVNAKVYATAPPPNEDKIRICHRTASYTNPYVEIEVDQNAADGLAGNSGNEADHYGEHQGPIFYPSIPKHTEWGDIIPPIPNVHQGLNWTAEGQAIWNSDCNFPEGSVKVEKRVDADGDGTFELGTSDSNAEKNQINNLGFRWALDDETPAREMGSTASDVTAGTHTVTENDVNGFVFAGWYVTGNTNGKSCSNPQGTTLPIDVTVVNDSQSKITFCNKKQSGSITIRKDAIPHTDTDFKFTTNISEDPFYLDDEPGAGVDNTPEQMAFTNLAAGTYTFTEEEATHWWLKKVECSEGATFELNGTTLTVTLAAGQNVTCTFKNHKKGKIEVTKQTLPDGAQQAFGITASGTGQITGATERQITDGETEEYEVTYGTYGVSEDVPSGWKQTSNTCTGLVINEQNLERSCTIVNEKQQGTITVIKNVDTDGDGDVDENDVTDWNWDIDGQGNYATGSQNSQTVQAGVYTVSEQQKTGYHVTASSCGDDEEEYEVYKVVLEAMESVQTTVGANEDVVCTFTNTRDTGKITVEKVVQGDNGVFDLSINGDTQYTAYNQADGGTTGDVLVVTGTYTVSETGGTETNISDYFSHYECHNSRQELLFSGTGTVTPEFEVAYGDHVHCKFVNTKKSKLTIVKDAQPNDAQDFEFSVTASGLPYSTFTLDDDDTSDTPNSNTMTVFTDVFNISEAIHEDWNLENISCTGDVDKYGREDNTVSLHVGPGADVTCTFTNVKKKATLTVVKKANPKDGTDFNFHVSHHTEEHEVEDDEYDALPQAIEEVWDDEGYHFILDNGYDDDAYGKSWTKEFEHEGYFDITESQLQGWELVDIKCYKSDMYEGELELQKLENGIRVYLEFGDNVTCKFFNQKQARVIVTKYNDVNKDKCFSETIYQEEDDEPEFENEMLVQSYVPHCYPHGGIEGVTVDEKALPGWEFTLGETSQTTGEDGSTTFEDVKPYDVHWLSETQQDGWNLSGMWCDGKRLDVRDNVQRVSEDTPEAGQFPLYLYPGQTLHCYVGNYHDPVLELTKSNNQPNPVYTGTTVMYTLKVSVPEEGGVVCDVTVNDVAPDDFTYVAGSFTAQSSVRGDLKAALVTTDPAYAGGNGAWFVGTLIPGEVVTLTYQAVIESTVSPGTYPDLAYAVGDTCPSKCEDDEEIEVLSNLHKAPTPFVGTQVVVIAKTQPQVLGAVTLENTGTPVNALQFALPAALVVLTLRVSRRRKEARS
jgi:Prealbumin-like fold domain